MSKLNDLDVSVSSPCNQSWGNMLGGPHARHCNVCNKSVYDLAHMRRDAIELLAMQSAAVRSVCARVTRTADGELVIASRTEESRSHTRPLILSAALAAGLPAVAQIPQFGTNTDMIAARSEPPTVPEAAGDAILTGTLLKPDGAPVSSGLINFSGSWFVTDDRGRFELHSRPGTYDVVVQTGPTEAEHIGAVELHEGAQSFGDLRTLSGQGHLIVSENTVTMGTVSATLSWSWRGRLRHPLLYVRSIVRKSR